MSLQIECEDQAEVDRLSAALSAVPEASRSSEKPENKDLVDLYNGLRMTEKILLSTLKKHGLEKLSPLGEKFDPNLHEATFQARVEGKEPGTVFHVQRTGFMLNGRVLRVSTFSLFVNEILLINFFNRLRKLALSRLHNKCTLLVSYHCNIT